MNLQRNQNLHLPINLKYVLCIWNVTLFKDSGVKKVSSDNNGVEVYSTGAAPLTKSVGSAPAPGRVIVQTYSHP